MNGAQLEKLNQAIMSAYNTRTLAQMLEFRLDKQLEQYAALTLPIRDIVFELTTQARAEGWLLPFVDAARRYRPENDGLAALSQELKIPPITMALEKSIRAELPYIDIVKWRTRLTELESQLCQIEILDGAASVYGTGFLIAPNLVMTNHHVMKTVITGQHAPQSVVLRFDFKQLADGKTVYGGTRHRLAADWLQAFATPSVVDEMRDPGSALPELDALDYVLLRVAGAPGREPVSVGVPAPQAPQRGWIRLPEAPLELAANAPLFILQHPERLPLKLAIETQSIIEFNGNRTRLRHRTNTEAGSSGAPCFDADWNLVALHQAGDPNFSKLKPATWNQAIPIAAIREHLKRLGKLALLHTDE